MGHIDRRPCLKPYFATLRDGDSGVYLLSDQEAILLRGRVYARLASCLDGGRTVPQLIDELGSEGISPAEVYYALDRLERRGCLLNGDEPRDEPVWESAEACVPLSPEALNRVRSEHCLRIVDLTGRGEEALAAGIRRNTIRSTHDPAEATCTVVLVEDYLSEEVAAVADECRNRAAAWLPMRPTGRDLWAGPMLGGENGSCFSCLTNRLRDNFRAQEVLRRRPRSNGHEWTRPALADPAVATVTRLALAILASEKSGTPELWSLSPGATAPRRHPVPRRPQCPACGDPGLIAMRGASPPALASRKKIFTIDGGHRTRSPEETLGSLRPLIGEVTGIVPRLQNVPGAEEAGIFAFASGHNVAMPAGSWSELVRVRREVSGGKGMSEAQAKASAVCEAIERYSSTFRGNEPRMLATAEELGEEALTPPSFLHFSWRQYEERQRTNAESSDLRLFVPEPFDVCDRIEWTPVWSLRDGTRRYLPTASCYLGYGRSEAAGGPSGFAVADSNGVAAGNHIEEAILQGFLELVERDAVAMWWYNRVRRPAVSLESFDDPRLLRLCDVYAALGRSFWLLDLTADLGIPVYAGVSLDDDPDTTCSVLLGFGAHLDPVVAASRALTEMNQMLRTPPAGGSAGEGGSLRSELDPERRPWESVHVPDHEYLLPLPGELRSARASAPPVSEDLLEDIQFCVERAHAKGLAVYALDHTQPDVGLPVARVVVPGLRHFWPRFGPGRLYEVPVSLGWLSTQRREEELNRVPVFFQDEK